MTTKRGESLHIMKQIYRHRIQGYMDIQWNTTLFNTALLAKFRIEHVKPGLVGDSQADCNETELWTSNTKIFGHTIDNNCI